MKSIWRGLAAVLMLGWCATALADNPPYAPGSVMMLYSGTGGGPNFAATPVSTAAPLPVSILSLPLPAGGATSALQTTGNGFLSTLATASTTAATSTLQTTGNTSLASILAGMATAGNQATANTALASIVTNTTGLATAANQATGNTTSSTIATNTSTTATNTGTVATNTGTVATNTTAISTATGAQADTAYAGSGSSSIIAALKGIWNKLAGTLTTADQNGAAFGSALVMTVGGSPVAVGRSVEILCTVAGNVSLQLGGSAHIISISASPYTQTFPYAVTGINTSGTTATASYSNLY